jgi:Trk K+ transport system NAD-binding subunit
MRLDKGYGVSRIRLHEGSPVAGRYLRDLDLKSRMIQILGIERDGKFFPIPVGDDKIEAGDQLIVYGTEGAIRRVFNTDATSPFKIVQPAETPAEGAEPRGKSGAGR